VETACLLEVQPAAASRYCGQSSTYIKQQRKKNYFLTENFRFGVEEN